nr:hypothetical protein Iba_scaffold37842CG0010 [Ipomoea batatas]
MPNLSTVKTDDMEALKFHLTRNVVYHHHCHNRFSQINLNRTPREFAPLNSCCSHIKFQRCSYHSQDVFNRIFPEVFDREPRHPNLDDHPFHLCCGGVEFWLPPLGNNILIEQFPWTIRKHVHAIRLQLASHNEPSRSDIDEFYLA